MKCKLVTTTLITHVQALPISNSTIKYINILLHLSISSSVLFSLFFFTLLHVPGNEDIQWFCFLVLGEYSHVGNIGKRWPGSLVPLNLPVESPIRGIQGRLSIKSHKIIWGVIPKFSEHGLPVQTWLPFSSLQHLQYLLHNYLASLSR